MRKNKSLVFQMVFALSSLFISRLVCASEEKLTPQDLVSKHVQSVGTKEKLEARKTSLAEGRGVMKSVTASIEAPKAAAAVFVSDGEKWRLNMKFSHPTYPHEQLAFDGKAFETGYVEGVQRSSLGSFLYTYSAIGKEGLLGGVLSTAWPLLDLEKHDPKLQYRGKKKLDGKETHELRYQMKKGQSIDLTISLYFDTGNYRHLATIYAIRDSNIWYSLKETFDEFQEVEGLTLPTRYTIFFSIETSGSRSETAWDMKFDRITINRSVDPRAFVLRQ